MTHYSINLHISQFSSLFCYICFSQLWAIGRHIIGSCWALLVSQYLAKLLSQQSSQFVLLVRYSHLIFAFSQHDSLLFCLYCLPCHKLSQYYISAVDVVVDCWLSWWSVISGGAGIPEIRFLIAASKLQNVMWLSMTWYEWMWLNVSQCDSISLNITQCDSISIDSMWLNLTWHFCDCKRSSEAWDMTWIYPPFHDTTGPETRILDADSSTNFHMDFK